MLKFLILWDIDGTILRSSGAGMASLNEALAEVFGVQGSLEGIDFAGRTDRMIIRQIFAKFGIEHTQANFDRLVEGYVQRLPSVLARSRTVVLPGVAALLGQAATRHGSAQGLLTGNLRRGAEAKLGFHGLWGHFPVGAFADDSEQRDELGPHALRRAAAHWGVDFPAERVWIIGDTPHDIRCARAFGARAMATATGSSGLEELRAHRPDAAFEDLGDTEAFWRVIES